ncbi:Aspartate aminotransferase [Spironucleus salmonicida]|uniref:Aspartate aminotransferase n=1 Tax=Spironucleus salmonicida TaxID=348837 RepID=V6LEY1_9EUKA|nr:Aspartate aminotransferase [Spironucleus salmonicida]|eukprot:EST43090.1 Aspartate aminotransferase [Spironucleus salmonicida]
MSQKSSQAHQSTGQTPQPIKYDLAKGTILDADSNPLLLQSVRQAELYLAANLYDKSYPPAAGICKFLETAREIAQIEDFASVATPSCGAFQVALQVLKNAKINTVVTRSPTWFMYAAFCAENGVILVESELGLLELAKQLQPGEALLLQAGCYNPDGADLTRAEFAAIAEIVKAKRGFVLLDIAYQGVKCSILEDNAFTSLYGANIVVMQFFDKNFGIYAEGASAVHFSDKLAQLELEGMVERKFGIVPVHGQYLVSTVWSKFRDMYLAEMDEVRALVRGKRELLSSNMDKVCLTSSIMQQNGIYAFLDFNEQQMEECQTLGLKLAPRGRVNLCGINAENVRSVCDILKTVMQ